MLVNKNTIPIMKKRKPLPRPSASSTITSISVSSSESDSECKIQKNIQATESGTSSSEAISESSVACPKRKDKTKHKKDQSGTDSDCESKTCIQDTKKPSKRAAWIERFFHVLFHEPDHEMSLFEHFLSFRWLRLPPITVGSITLLIAATIKDHMFARIEGSWDNINLCDFNK